MSAGEMSALIQGKSGEISIKPERQSADLTTSLLQGILGSRRCHSSQNMANMVPPDNRCCFCLTLQTGTVGIGIGYCLLYMAIFTGYILFPEETGLKDNISLTNLDWSFIGICGVEIVMNVLLVIGAIMKIPRHTIPWLCLNAILVGICMVCIVITVFFGTNKMELTYSEYVTSLIILGLVTGINIFCCIVVFQFRHNLIMERQMELTRQFDDPICSSPPCSAPPFNPPPPSYDEVGQSDYKIVDTEDDNERIKAPLEDGPPEYEEAVNMTGPVQRKKSLTNNAV